MVHLRQLQQPSILAPVTNPQLKLAREALCSVDEDFKKTYADFLDLLKTKSNDSKHETKEREKKDYFQLLDYKAELDSYNKVMAFRHATAEILKQANEDAKREAKAASDQTEMKKHYDEMATTEHKESKEQKPGRSEAILSKANELNQQITHHQAELNELHTEIRRLDSELVNRHDSMEKISKVTATDLAGGMVEQLTKLMNLDKLKSEAKNAGDAKQVEDLLLLEHEIKRTTDALQPVIATTLANATPRENLRNHIKPLDDKCAREEKKIGSYLENPLMRRNK